MPSSSFRRLLSATALVSAMLAGTPAQAVSFSGMFVFGDSLSDSGNNALAGLYDPAQVITGNSYVPSNTYGPNGTYTNGPVWATYFAQMLGVPLVPSLAPGGGNNFAAGGATTGTPGPGQGGYPFSLRVQAGQFLGATGGVAPADALYVVAGGGNNARAALGAIFGGADPGLTVGSTAAGFADDIGDIVDDLQAAGAQHIVVWNTPNISLVPAISAGGAQAVGLASLLVNAMNGQLALRLAGESGVTTFDTYSFGSMIVANPAAFGLTNVSDACGAVVGANCSQYAYWDGIHPTTAVHRLVANAMAQAVPEPQTYALLALGLVVVGWQAPRRRRAAAAA